MAGELIYAFRVMRLPLLDAGGAPVGRIVDLVAIPGRPGRAGEPAIAPRIVGFVANVQRRRIFVSANRIGELNSDGARLKSWDIDVNPFKPRSGEVVIGEDLIDRRVGDETVSDIALEEHTDGRNNWWEIDKVRLTRKSGLTRRPSYRLVDYEQVPALFDAPTEAQAEAARLRILHPAEVAAIVRSLPDARRRQLAEAMDDERLADVLEELPESEQVRIVEGLDRDRLVGVFDEMELDDLADLLGEMPEAQQEQMLAVMDGDDADVMRRLLSYEKSTAGGMMTPEVVIFGPTDTVADALAQIRDPEWVSSVAGQVFVCQAPYKAPTGRFLGVVHFQRLLREPPGMELGRLVRDGPQVSPHTTDREVAEELANYDLLALPVCDEAGRLLGAVSVDDVIDRMLGVGWRTRRKAPPRSEATPEGVAT
jgi:CBS domain-containing protein